MQWQILYNMLCFLQWKLNFLYLLFFLINKTLFAVTTTVRDRMPEQCRRWVNHGDCYLHQEFMLQNCRESCMAGGYLDGEYKCTLRCSLTKYPGIWWPKERTLTHNHDLSWARRRLTFQHLSFPFDSPCSRERDVCCIGGHLKSCNSLKVLLWSYFYLLTF